MFLILKLIVHKSFLDVVSSFPADYVTTLVAWMIKCVLSRSGDPCE